MSEQKDGGPAFPLQSAGPYFAPGYAGMTLRDYFAVHASADDLRTHIEAIREEQRKQCGAAILPDKWASLARYMHADAMLKARAQSTTTVGRAG